MVPVLYTTRRLVLNHFGQMAGQIQNKKDKHPKTPKTASPAAASQYLSAEIKGKTQAGNAGRSATQPESVQT